MPVAIRRQSLIAFIAASVVICSCSCASLSEPETLAASLTHSLPTSNQQQQQQHQHPTITSNNNNNNNDNKNQRQADAPKFYHLNELLYKTSNGDESPQTAASPSLTPLGGAKSHLKPIGMMTAHGRDAADRDYTDDDSSIETLVKRMRGRARPHEEASSAIGGDSDGNSKSSEGGPKTNGGGNFIGPEDEATIQRKSTNLDDDSSGRPSEASGSPSRIRARDNVPRGKRRASTRYAPPKLKARRISRNSRRRKLRHGVKPRRRA